MDKPFSKNQELHSFLTFPPKTPFESHHSNPILTYLIRTEPTMSTLFQNRHHSTYSLCLFGMIIIIQSWP